MNLVCERCGGAIGRQIGRGGRRRFCETCRPTRIRRDRPVPRSVARQIRPVVPLDGDQVTGMEEATVLELEAAGVPLDGVAALCALIWFDAFTRLTGFLLLAVLILYIALSLLADQNADTPAAEMHVEEGGMVPSEFGIGVGLIIAIVGMVAIIFGANLLVQGAVTIARTFGISEAVIGMSIVAIGTSLPELATSVVASTRGKADVALGNVIGSNIFNILGILGVTALVHPFSVIENQAGNLSGEAMQTGTATSIISTGDIGALVLSLFFLLLFGITGRKIARWEGALLLAGYALYMGLLFHLIPVPAILPHG